VIPTVKAYSVTEDGEADGFVNPLLYAQEVGPDGTTRLLVSCGPERLEELHRALIAGLQAPLGVVCAVGGPGEWAGSKCRSQKVVELGAAC